MKYTGYVLLCVTNPTNCQTDQCNIWLQQKWHSCTALITRHEVQQLFNNKDKGHEEAPNHILDTSNKQNKHTVKSTTTEWSVYRHYTSSPFKACPHGIRFECALESFADVNANRVKIASTLPNPNAHWTAKLRAYCHVFLHFVTRKNGVS